MDYFANIVTLKKHEGKIVVYTTRFHSFIDGMRFRLRR
jgi:hypothetical protein